MADPRLRKAEDNIFPLVFARSKMPHSKDTATLRKLFIVYHLEMPQDCPSWTKEGAEAAPPEVFIPRIEP